jgi:Family of unknown function (DUF5343)
MAESKLPYMNGYGNITKGLEKIKGAETPERFSQDFLADTLGMTGGGARPLIAYLKRTGFLGSGAEQRDASTPISAAAMPVSVSNSLGGFDLPGTEVA